MTFSINTIRTTFQQVNPNNTAQTTTYVNTSYSQTRALNSVVSSVVPQAPQRSYIKIVNPVPTVDVNQNPNPGSLPGVQFGRGSGIGSPIPTQNSSPLLSPASSPASAAAVEQSVANLLIAISGQISKDPEARNTGTVAQLSGPASSELAQIIPPVSPQTILITLSSSFFGESFFSGNSALISPFTSDLFEMSTGNSLREEEKPKILANIIEDVRRDGFGRSNSIIVRKMKSSRGTPRVYKILRKNMFLDTDFKEIASLEPESLFLDPKYNEIVLAMGYTTNSVFVFTDRAILINTIFVYKVQIEWSDGTSAAKKAADIAAAVAGSIAPGDLGFLNIIPTEPSPSASASVIEQNVAAAVANASAGGIGFFNIIPS